MKLHLDNIAPLVALVLGVVFMAFMVLSDEYAHAAGAEARGYQAWFAGSALRSGAAQ